MLITHVVIHAFHSLDAAVVCDSDEYTLESGYVHVGVGTRGYERVFSY